MTLKRIDSFLSVLSLMLRRYFLDLRMTYEYSENEEIAEVSVSRVTKGEGLTLVPAAIFSVSESSIRFIKLDLDSDIDFVEYEVSSLFELKMVVLRVVFLLIQGERQDLDLNQFLSKVFASKIDGLADVFEYLCKVNLVDYMRDPDYLYVYDYGNFQFFDDAVSFMSTQSARVVYRIDTDLSAISVLTLAFDAMITVLSDGADDDLFVKVFERETEEELIAPPEEGEEDGFDEFGGGGFDDFGGEGGMGKDFGGGPAPTDSSPSDMGDTGGGDGFPTDEDFQ